MNALTRNFPGICTLLAPEAKVEQVHYSTVVVPLYRHLFCVLYLFIFAFFFVRGGVGWRVSAGLLTDTQLRGYVRVDDDENFDHWCITVDPRCRHTKTDHARPRTGLVFARSNFSCLGWREASGLS